MRHEGEGGGAGALNRMLTSSRVQQKGLLGATIYEKLSQSQSGECVFCYEEMANKEKVVQLACYKTHQFHEQCYNNFVEYFEKSQSALLCPLCRAPVDKSQVVKKVLEIAEPSTMKVQDAFALQAD